MLIHHPEVVNDPEEQWLLLRQAAQPADRERLRAAYYLAGRIHAGQTRRRAQSEDAVPYIVHPLRVARIVAEEWGCRDLLPLVACLLHDVIEDCPETLRASVHQEIERLEGKETADAVYALSKPRLPVPCPPDIKAARDARYFRVLFQQPPWVRMVKCADRVDNLRDARLWGDLAFWKRYSSETIGWHLYLARETAPIIEVALFKALVEGERAIRGRVPLWADGRMIDPTAAALVPEHISRRYRVIGLAQRGNALILGAANDDAEATRQAIRAALAANQSVCAEFEFQRITADALHDAISAGLYGSIEPDRRP